jgi:hypothetical protein
MLAPSTVIEIGTCVYAAAMKFDGPMQMPLPPAMSIASLAICQGPANLLGSAYQQLPIGITVEGANILTRSLIIFGQGAIRCHPYVLKEMRAAHEATRRRSTPRCSAISVTWRPTSCAPSAWR